MLVFASQPEEVVIPGRAQREAEPGEGSRGLAPGAAGQGEGEAAISI